MTADSIRPQLLATCTCNLLAFMYGQAVGWSSAAMPAVREQLGPKEGWLGGTFCLGALAAALLYGPLADRCGRKVAGFLVAACFSIDWTLTIIGRIAGSAVWLLAARVVGGAGASGSITVATLYCNEAAAPRLRSALGAVMALQFVLGIFAAYALGPHVSYVASCSAYLGTSLLFAPLWWFMPESPAHLLLHGRDGEALTALRWLRGAEGAEGALERLRAEQRGAVRPASLRRFAADPAARRAALLSCALVSVQTFSGMFALNMHAGAVFERAGGALTASTGPMVYGAVMVLGAAVPPLVADRLPRRLLLGVSCAALATGMAVLSANAALRPSWSALPALVMSFCVFAYYVGLGSVLYVYVGELFTDEMRGVGGALFSAAMWSTSFVLLQFYGAAVEALGDCAVFAFFSGTCCIGVLGVLASPETRGRSPGEVRAALIGSSRDSAAKGCPSRFTSLAQ